MTIAVIGLGRMGSQIARKLHEAGHTVIAHNRSREPIDEMRKKGLIPAYSKEEVVSAFGTNLPVVWLMVPAAAVRDELDAWQDILPAGSIIVDGGNSDYRNTKENAEKIAKKKIILLDVGTSGGVWGYQQGFSLMGGGDRSAYEKIVPALDTLAHPSGAHRYFGPSGAGHFVKMVHNAIEYGMMESLAEGYRLLKEGPYAKLDLAEAGDVWQHHSVITSWLNELARDALKENPTLAGIEGVVAESGEARWALETAKDLNLPMPSIQASFDVRLASQKGKTHFGTKILAAMRNKFGGHPLDGSH